MDSRDLLSTIEEVFFLYDTDSLYPGNVDTELLDKFLRYRHYDDFLYLRTPSETEIERLHSIPAYSFESINDGRAIQYEIGEVQTSLAYQPNPELTQRRFERTSMDQHIEHEMEMLEIFNQFGELRDESRVFVLVTASETLLSHRRELEHQFRRHSYEENPLNIFSMEEAAEYAGIFKRSRDHFEYPTHEGAGGFQTGLTSWCWSITQLFLPHTMPGDEQLDSMKDRFEALFLAIDAIGEQYYQGTGNHTDIRTRYHFNNGVALLTGIFDILALHTRDSFEFKIEDRHTNLRSGGQLIAKLESECPSARRHVLDHEHLVDFLHIIRNDIIHQSGVAVRGPGFRISVDDASDWNSQNLNLSKLSADELEELAEYYGQFNDSVETYDPVTRWGLLIPLADEPAITGHTFFEPYRFLKQATLAVLGFADEYLKTLGYSNRFDNHDFDDFSSTLTQAKLLLERELHPLIIERDSGLLP